MNKDSKETEEEHIKAKWTGFADESGLKVVPSCTISQNGRPCFACVCEALCRRHQTEVRRNFKIKGDI